MINFAFLFLSFDKRNVVDPEHTARFRYATVKNREHLHSERHWRVSKGKRQCGAGRTLCAECNAYSVFLLFADFNFTLLNSMDEISFLLDKISLAFE